MTSEELTLKVFKCMCCDRLDLPFKRCRSGKYYRFPPMIGAVGSAPLLFIGINPSISDTNQQLHNLIVEDMVKFIELSRNRVGTSAYIGSPGLEGHYVLHVSVTQSLFPDSQFESVASVTELHFCASSSSVGLPYDYSKCATLYLKSVLEIVSPLLVFTVGAHVERTLRKFFGTRQEGITAKWSTGGAPVINLPHPNKFGPRRVELQKAISIARGYLNTLSPGYESG